MDELWDVKTAASHLGLSTRTVYQFVRDGRIPGIRVGGRWRFRQSDLDSWLQSDARGTGRTSPIPVPPAVPDAAALADFLSSLHGTLEKRLAFMALLTRACVGRGWQPPVIVGGQAVEFYSAGGYATVDIDLVSASEPLDEILPGWGFEQRGRHWMRRGSRSDCGSPRQQTGSRSAGPVDRGAGGRRFGLRARPGGRDRRSLGGLRPLVVRERLPLGQGASRHSQGRTRPRLSEGAGRRSRGSSPP